jgi:5-methylcytosine-specific restriction protein A
MLAELSPWQIVEQRFQCDHAQQSVVKYQQSNGQWRVRKQCQNCGEYTTSDLKMAGIDLNTIPEVDRSLREEYYKAKRTALDEARYTYLNQQQQAILDNRQKWWVNYNAYLQTDHWRKLRRNVILRDNFQCQNCFCKLTDTTAHVHHLSYTGFNRVGYSFAFECVTLCARCHNEFHAEVDYGFQQAA